MTGEIDYFTDPMINSICFKKQICTDSKSLPHKQWRICTITYDTSLNSDFGVTKHRISLETTLTLLFEIDMVRSQKMLEKSLY